ncbi:MAG: putative quinol monooxygenase [Pseudomonadota bacterium]
MKHTYTEGLVMLAELPIKPGEREAFLNYTAENLEISRSAKGNLAFDILVDVSSPETVLFYEVWESVAAQQAYMAWRIERGDLTTLMSFLAGEPKFTPLRRVAG